MATLRKSDPLRLLGKRVLIAFLAVVVVSTAVGVWDIYQKNAEASRLRSEAEHQLADLTARQKALQADYDFLKTNRGMETVLRESYNVGQDGEHMIVIVEPQQAAPLPQPASGWGWVQKIFSW